MTTPRVPEATATVVSLTHRNVATAATSATSATSATTATTASPATATTAILRIEIYLLLVVHLLSNH